MKFEWDTLKAASNIRKHGVSFEIAARIFEDELSASFPDPDHSIGEARWITYGLAPDGRVLVVAHAERDDTIRIISARVATKAERQRYENYEDSHPKGHQHHGGVGGRDAPRVRF